MNKKKLKKRIKELEDERDSYGIKTMLAYVEIEELKEQLIIADVSQQREQLIAFSEFVVKNVTRKGHEEVVDYFLKKHKGINCG